MIIENPDSLRNWLTSYLEPLCDADPQALAKYVMALIKKDKSEESLKCICQDQLDVFLQKETVPFVKVLFEAIKSKSYLNHPNGISEAENAGNTPTASSSKSPTKSNAGSRSDAQSEQNQSSSNQDPQNSNSATLSGPGSQALAPLVQQTNQSSSKRPYHTRQGSRSKSRSKSRSPPSSRHRTGRDSDSRRGYRSSGYYQEDRSRKMGGRGAKSNPRRYCSGSYKRQTGSNEVTRPRSNSRSRSRSWSNSTRSQSRSRSRSPPHRSDGKSGSDRDKDTTRDAKRSRREPPKSPGSPKEIKEQKNGDNKQRCRDYDEKGFCMRGDLCPFDHGQDPVVLDGVSSWSTGIALLPTPSLPQGSNAYLEYNPEAPGIDQVPARTRRSGTGVNPSQAPIPGPPITHGPPPPFWGPPGPSMRAPLAPGHQAPHFIGQVPPSRPRELVGVPTVPEVAAEVGNQAQEVQTRTVLESVSHGPSISSKRGRGGRRGRGFGRGGHRRMMAPTEQPDKCTLEVRKIPAELNNITQLNEHFSKFGPIVNLQINFEGDPEGAIVQFASRGDALAAYRSAEAVLNNRFIKLFWHTKEGPQTLSIDGNQMKNQESSTKEGDENEKEPQEERVSVKERLGVKMEKDEKVTTALSSSGTISRTVFNPKLLSKLQAGWQARAQGTIHGMGAKAKAEQKKGKLVKKVELHKKRQAILDTYVKQQKILIGKLEKAKSEKEKQEIRGTVMSLNAKVKELEGELKKEAGEMLDEASAKSKEAEAKTNSVVEEKAQIEKELLDAEMDFYNKLHKGEATGEIQSKLNDLRKEVRKVTLVK